MRSAQIPCAGKGVPAVADSLSPLQLARGTLVPYLRKGNKGGVHTTYTHTHIYNHYSYPHTSVIPKTTQQWNTLTDRHTFTQSWASIVKTFCPQQKPLVTTFLKSRVNSVSVKRISSCLFSAVFNTLRHSKPTNISLRLHAKQKNPVRSHEHGRPMHWIKLSKCLNLQTCWVFIQTAFCHNESDQWSTCQDTQYTSRQVQRKSLCFCLL